MTAVLLALAPVFLLIVLGHLLRRTQFLVAEAGADSFWAAADRLTYYLLFPALIVHTLALSDFSELAVAGMAGALAIPVLIIAAVLTLQRPRLEKACGIGGPGFTSVFQGAIRPNTYLGLASAFALYGDAGLTLAAVAVVTLVPLVNLLSAMALARHGANAHSGLGARLLVVARNPLILACAAGLALNVSGVGLPAFTGPLLDLLGRAALTLGLLSVGAGLDIAAARRSGAALWTAAGCKLVLLPAFTVLLLHQFGVGGVTAAVALLFAALPTSATSFVMSRQLGGDHTLMASIITAETLAAIVTLPAALIVLA